MTRFAKVYGRYFNLQSRECSIPKNNIMNREGYGYIKRRMGLLSNEIESPTYTSVGELSNFITSNISQKIAKS